MMYEETPILKRELEEAEWNYRVYGKDPHSYVGVCKLAKYGDKAIISNLSTVGMLRTVAFELLEGYLKEKGIRHLEGYVIDPVLERVEGACRDHPLLIFSSGDEFTTPEGRHFTWIKVTRKEKDNG